MKLKHVLTATLVFAIAFTLGVTAFAAEMRMNNVSSFRNRFYCSGSNAVVYVEFVGSSGTTTSATVASFSLTLCAFALIPKNSAATAAKKIFFIIYC